MALASRALDFLSSEEVHVVESEVSLVFFRTGHGGAMSLGAVVRL